MIRVAIIGATGRMGRALVRAATEFQELKLVGASASAGSLSLDQDIGELAGIGAIGVRVTSDLQSLLPQADVAIDFSQPQATRGNLSACRAARKPLLIGTTGIGPEITSLYTNAARDIPLLVAPNTSLTVSLLMELVRAAARTLPPEFDIEIIEAHHRQKVDAPSGTALALARAAVQGDGSREITDTLAGSSPSRAGRRREGNIGFASIRGGDIVGEHTVLFAGMGEQLALTHRVTDRQVFARGALRGALWLALQPAGLYSMRDLLGYKTEV